MTTTTTMAMATIMAIATIMAMAAIMAQSVGLTMTTVYVKNMTGPYTSPPPKLFA